MDQLLWFILVVSVVVFVHEFGHFIVARMFGVRVEKFSLGFGPRLLKRKDKKGTEWSISLIPLGGYVKMYGDTGAASVPDFDHFAHMSPQDKKASFMGKALWQKASIVFAGPFANYILAIICFTIVFQITGIPAITNQVTSVQVGSVAENIGVLPQDVIVSVNDTEVTSGEQFKSALSQAGQGVAIGVIRHNELITLGAFFDADNNKILGVVFNIQMHRDNIIGSFGAALTQAYIMSQDILIGIKSILIGELSTDNIGGPLKIAEYSSKAAAHSLEYFIWFIAAISLNLGLVNLLPIPMLDGGHLFFYIIEAITRKPLNRTLQMLLFRVGFAVLLMLMGLALFNDFKGLL